MIFAARNVEKRETMYIEADSALKAVKEARKIIAQNQSVGKIKEERLFFCFESNGSLICVSKEGVKH